MRVGAGVDIHNQLFISLNQEVVWLLVVVNTEKKLGFGAINCKENEDQRETFDDELRARETGVS